METEETETPGPICPVCNYIVFKINDYNGQKMCHACKKAIKRSEEPKKFKRERT